MFKCLILNVDKGELVKRSLGAYRISSFLRDHNWDAEVVEFAAHWPLEKLQQFAEQRITSDVKFIGLSCLFINEPVLVIDQFCEWIKIVYPHLKIILGGPNRYRFDNKYIDYNIHGFGELALLELLKYLFSNGKRPRFSLNNNSGKNIIANETYPSFPMSNLMVKYEDRDYIQPHEWLGVEFARGCVFSCAYCNFPVIGIKGDYTRDAADFRIQLQDAYDRFGVTNYYTSDETFNDRTEKITKFADVVETLSFSPFFTGFIRPDLLVSRQKDKEELLRMNYLGQFYGIESFYHKTGKIIGKGMDPEKLKTGLVEIKKYFETHGTGRFRGTISLIAGLPHEPISSLYDSRDWLVQNWQQQAYSIYPLEIPISEYDNPSKIGMAWTKYGYSDASVELKDYNAERVTVRQAGVLVWKNEQMNVKQAEEVAKDIDSAKYKDGNDFRQGNYSLLRLGFPENLDDRLVIPDGVNATFPKDFINKYIQQKLEL
jgi:hypothetical protein